MCSFFSAGYKKHNTRFCNIKILQEYMTFSLGFYLCRTHRPRYLTYSLQSSEPLIFFFFLQLLNSLF